MCSLSLLLLLLLSLSLSLFLSLFLSRLLYQPIYLYILRVTHNPCTIIIICSFKSKSCRDMYVYHSIYFQNIYSSKYYSPINPLLALIWLNILVWRPSKTKIICLFYSQLLFRGGNSVLAKMPHFLARETTSTLSVRHSFCSSYITGSSLSTYHSTGYLWK